MPTFITLLAPKAKGPEAVDYLKKLKAPEGIEIRCICFTLGRYDGVIVYEAPDEKAAVKFAMQIAYETGWRVETLTAVSVEEV